MFGKTFGCTFDNMLGKTSSFPRPRHPPPPAYPAFGGNVARSFGGNFVNMFGDTFGNMFGNMFGNSFGNTSGDSSENVGSTFGNMFGNTSSFPPLRHPPPPACPTFGGNTFGIR